MKNIILKGFCFLMFAILCNIKVSYAQTLTAKDTAEVRFVNSRKFYLYKVEKGETLFSISQKFKIPQEEILEFNKEIDSQGLKTKSKIWIPAYSWMKKDQTSVSTVKEDEPDDNTINIGIVTSLGLNKVYIKDPDINDSSYVQEGLSKEVSSNLEFVEGVLQAIKKNKSTKVHLFTIDADFDSAKVLQKLRKTENLHYIITNETGGTLRNLSSFAIHKNIRLISAGFNTTDIIMNNKNSISLLPSSLLQCERIGLFASKYFPNAKFIILKTGISKENERGNSFISGLQSGKSSYSKVDYSKGGISVVKDSLSKTRKNVLFVPTSNEDLVTGILNGFKEMEKPSDINVIGLPTWQYFETVDHGLMEKSNTILFNSGFINTDDAEVFSFRKFFRDEYSSEPSESAYQGFDCGLVVTELIKKWKKNSDVKSLPEVNGLYSNYHFTRIDESSSFQNETIYIFHPGKESVDLSKNVKWK